jgi:hypothetical protein
MTLLQTQMTSGHKEQDLLLHKKRETSSRHACNFVYHKIVIYDTTLQFYMKFTTKFIPIFCLHTLSPEANKRVIPQHCPSKILGELWK